MLTVQQRRPARVGDSVVRHPVKQQPEAAGCQASLALSGRRAVPWAGLSARVAVPRIQVRELELPPSESGLKSVTSHIFCQTNPRQ